MSPARDPPELPEHVGPYRVLQVLGEGGMGAVYEAEETGPVRRRVAVKVIRAGLNSREIVARFEAERQALALMNHPGIAKVLHAGTTEAGEPFFAMELVRGLPLTQYCDTHRLPLVPRIELFIAVCRAVQHAHQKGVIHRDLKPSNVLVSEQDGTPHPKIIDFGIAKAVGQQLTESTLVTLGGQAIGTAAYMSPEQADSAGVDIDTRSDIYSLGVMLYELLVGQLPLDPGEVGLHVFLARVASGETDPPTPSARLSAARARSAEVARSRRTDAARLRRELRGDLDWIVMKALDPERSRRYETANGLANDLHRHLQHEPVLARQPSTRYRFGKFVRRHRLGAAATGIVCAAIVVGAILATVGFMRARRAERHATQEAAAAQQVTAFLVDLFQVSNPAQARGNTLTARDLLERGAQRVRKELTGQPLLQARLLQTMGTVHQQLGFYDAARPLLEDALRIRERALGRKDSLVAETLNSLGDVERGKGDFGAADSAYRRALVIRESLFGREHVEVATTLGGLAALRVKEGKSAEAESLYKIVVPLDERVRSHDDPRRLRNLRTLAVVYWNQARYAEAEPLLRGVLDIQQRTLGADHPDVAGTLTNLGGLYWRLGRYAEALAFYEQARPIYEKTYEPIHPEVAGVYNNFGEAYWKLKRYAEAERFLRRSLAIKQQVLTPGHPSFAVTLNALAGLLRDQARYVAAEQFYRQALEIRERSPGTDAGDLAETLRD
ncbi:MAG TPA: serine/threonine-protein kinase, partial [Gemmatimonadales bacterium]|nr:serine/threonine-protein kinase [Gemmatimonadales bacterium]